MPPQRRRAAKPPKLELPEPSRYERNVLAQPRLIEDILSAPEPAWMARLRRAPIHFVGVGTSRHAAEIARALWKRLVSPRAEAVHSFDFARLPQAVGRGDVVVLLSHRGGEGSFTVEAARKAAEAGAVTVAITGEGAVWREELAHRLDCCPLEDTGAFTKSFSTTMAWICKWIGDPALLEGVRRACRELPTAGPRFPKLSKDTDVVLLGDLEREWVARETALKLQEAAYLRARPFGLEEFLHGPRLSVGRGGVAIGFTGPGEPRWKQAREYLSAIGVPLVEVDGLSLPADAAWLGQVFWGQRLTTAACRSLGIHPDEGRLADPRYRKGLAAG
jgi:glucosamine--fructose-6-phosphate aminotransferase (isomerizing)